MKKTCIVKYIDMSVGASDDIITAECTDKELDILCENETAGMILIQDIKEIK